MKIAVIKQTIALVEDETLISGMDKEVTVAFSFDPTWDGYMKTALFKAGSVEESVTLEDDQCILPATLLKTPGLLLKVCVQGSGAEAQETSWGLISRILYPTNIDIPIPPSPSPTPEGEVGRLCTELAQMLSSEYTEEELADMTLIDVMSEMDDLNNTATDGEVENVLDDVWGDDDSTSQVKRLCEELAAALRSKYTEEELKTMSLSDVVVDIDTGNTATDGEVADAINDVWGPEGS